MSTDQSHSQTGQSVGARLRVARLTKRYTQSQLASPDFSVSYISAIERGQIQPSLRALEILARRLELSSTQLLREHSSDGNEPSTPWMPSVIGEEEVELVLLEAQVGILQGVASEAIGLLNIIAPKNLTPRQHLQQQYLLGWAYLSTAQLQKCEQVLSKVAHLAEEQKNSYLSLQALNLLGLAHAAMHNYPQAIQSHHHCLQLLEESQPRDPFLVSQVYNHLGLHYTVLENFDAASEMFKQAIIIAEGLTDIQRVQSVYWNIRQYYVQAQEYHLATLYAHKWLHLQSRQVVHLKREIYHHLGHAMLKRDQEEARIYLENALRQESIVQDSLISASVLTHMGEWLLSHKELEKAEEYALKARELALPSGDTIFAADVLILLGRITYAQEQYEVGDTYFVVGLEMLGHIGMQDELVERSVLYAQLLEKRGKEREALTYYRRAFESHREMEVYI